MGNGKAPAFQFYVRDWLADPQLKMASFSTKGIWIDLLCYLWEAPERGMLKGSVTQLERLIGANHDEFGLFLAEAKDLSFCDISVTDNKIVTICNRRMFRDEKDRKNNRMRQSKHREKRKSNAKVTPPSSTASSTSPTKITTLAQNEFDQFWLSYPKQRSKADALKAWKQVSKKRPTIEIILSKIEDLKNSHEWTKENGQFIPYPASWLRAGGWDDVINQKPKMTYAEREKWGKGLNPDED